jgi:hypothetical protein
MGTSYSPRVTEAERANGDVIVTFDNGKCALFTAALLWSILPQAQEVIESDE